MGFFDWILPKQNIYYVNSNPARDFQQKKLDFSPIDVTDAFGQHRAYLYTPIINTIIDRIAKLGSNCNYFIENIDKETINSTTGKKLIDILNAPNAAQNNTEFIENYITNLMIYGEVFIIPIKIGGIQDIKGLSILPNHRLEIEMDYAGYPMLITPTNFIKTIKYTNPSNQVVDLTEHRESIIIIKNTQSANYPSRGISKFPSLIDHINKYLIACNASSDLLQNYGAIGMWVNEGKDSIGTSLITPEEQEELQQKMQSQYGITKGKKKHIFTSQNLRYEKVSLPISELMLDETVIDSIKTICDSLGYPYDLLAIEKKGGIGEGGGREAEAKRQLISETIEPSMYKLSESLTKAMLAKGEFLQFYYDHLPFMQESEKSKAELNKIYADTYITMIDKGLMTIEEVKEKLINLEIL